ncbi:hypothetical protein F8M41_019713 [Gigaspora margarita]|uniref:Uncharacterized protein n=1 Tax=Gigaspora margarita TaxID=4874 RepID=A0A8H4EKF5_GIGMA|nr:hypothetical protein F8M41_019713 [Gigaspora margarita]
MTRKSGDDKNLYRQIKESQDEIEQLSVLDEFIDTVINVDNRPAPDRCEQLWTLSNQIYAAFQNPNPNSHLLFEYTTQNTSKGYSNIETCYQHEIKRRASKNLVKDTVANFKQQQKIQKRKRKDNNQSEDNESTSE